MTRATRSVQSLKVGSAAQLLPVVAGYGAQLLTTPYVLGRLGLHDFGIWSITGAIAQYGALFDLGVSRAANRYVALFHAKGDAKSDASVVGICIAALLGLWVALSGLVLATPHLVDSVLGTDDPMLARNLLLYAVAILVVGLLARVLAAASVGRGRLVPAGVGVAILSTLQACGGVAALAVRPSLSLFAAGTLAGTAFGLAVVTTIILVDERRIHVAMPSLPLARELIAYGVKSQVAAAGDMLLLQSGKLIAGIMIGPAAAGIYELASRLATGAQVLGAASASALTPHLTRSYLANGMDGILSEYEHLTRRNTAVAIMTPFAMAATAIALIPFWLDGGHGQVVEILFALVPGVAVNLSTAVSSSTLMAIGRPAVIAYVTVAGGVFQAVLATSMAYVWGFAGIAVAFAIGVPVAKFFGQWYMQRSAGIPMILYVRGAAGPYAAAVAASCAALPIGLLTHPHNRESAVWPFVVSAAIFCGVYLALGWSRDYLPKVIRWRRTSNSAEPERGRHRWPK